MIAELLEGIWRATPCHRARLVPQFPRDLETITLKCLERALHAATARLKRWRRTSAAGLTAGPFGTAGNAVRERAGALCRRRPVIAALTAALSLTLSIGFFAVVVLWRQAEPNAGVPRRSFASRV